MADFDPPTTHSPILAPTPDAPPVSTLAVQDRVEALVRQAQDGARSVCHDVESFVKESPGAAVLASVATGYVLRSLPVGAIVRANIRLLVALAPPAIFAFGAAKLVETLKARSREPRL